MGSWNETCSASRLPVVHGDEVVWVALIQRPGVPDQDFIPLGVPFFGTYNDYGGVDEPWSQEEQKLWCSPDGFLKKMIPVTQGDNQYHDHRVDLDVLNEKGFEHFQTALSSRRVFIKEQDFYSDTFEKMSRKDENGKDLATRNHEAKPLIVRRCFVLKSIWDYVQNQGRFKPSRIEQELRAARAKLFTKSVYEKQNVFVAGFSFSERSDHPLTKYRSSDEGLAVSTADVLALHKKLVEDKDWAACDVFEKKISQLLCFEIGMYGLRLNWTVSNVSNQENDVEATLNFNKHIMLTALKSRSVEYEEEDSPLFKMADQLHKTGRAQIDVVDPDFVPPKPKRKPKS